MVDHSDVEAVYKRIESIRSLADNSSFCGEYTDEQAQEIARLGRELAECQDLHRVLKRAQQLSAADIEKTTAEDEYVAGIIHGLGLTEDQVGDHPLHEHERQLSKYNTQLKSFFKEALERIDKQPTKLGTILMSTDTARSLGIDVPENAPVEVEKMRIGDHVAQVGRCIDVALWYPDNPRSINTIMVSLIDVRAADSILISYDKARDGWSIKQASTFIFDENDTVCDPDWQEVAFIQAWAREKT